MRRYKCIHIHIYNIYYIFVTKEFRIPEQQMAVSDNTLRVDSCEEEDLEGRGLAKSFLFFRCFVDITAPQLNVTCDW